MHVTQIVWHVKSMADGANSAIRACTSGKCRFRIKRMTNLYQASVHSRPSSWKLLEASMGKENDTPPNKIAMVMQSSL